MSRNSIQRLDVLLKQVIGDSPLRPGLTRQEALSSWAEIVGAEIARHSEAVALEDGVLLVRTEGSVWAQELSLLKPRIQESLNARLGEDSVKEIRFTTAHREGYSRPSR